MRQTTHQQANSFAHVFICLYCQRSKLECAMLLFGTERETQEIKEKTGETDEMGKEKRQ